MLRAVLKRGMFMTVLSCLETISNNLFDALTRPFLPEHVSGDNNLCEVENALPIYANKI